METTPYEQALEHVMAARKLLVHPAADALRLSTSGSRDARAMAVQEAERVERLRVQLLALVEDLARLDENLYTAQHWHDRYWGVTRK